MRSPGSRSCGSGFRRRKSRSRRSAKYLVGAPGECTIVDHGYTRQRDIALEMPDSPLEAVMSKEVWSQVYDRLAELVKSIARRSSSSIRAGSPSGSRAT
jgi:ATP-dependent Lhr-like helicase